MTEMHWGYLFTIFLAIELMLGTGYLFILALNFLLGLAAALLGLTTEMQLLLVSASSIISVLVFHQFKKARAALKPIEDSSCLDCGNTITVTSWNESTASVMYRGATWNARLETPVADPAVGPYQITSIEGSVLVIKPIQ